MKEIKENKEEAEKKAAEIIRDSINNVLEDKEFVVFAVPGGRSVVGIFNNLIELEIPWTKVHIFMVDERMVSIEDEKSNFKLANEIFISELVTTGKMPEKNIHPFLVDSGIKGYEQEIMKYGGDYDIILLSSGEDGHIGALYPGHHSMDDDSAFYIEMDDSPKPPPRRMTMSRKMVLRAKTALLLFFGEGKREAYLKFNDDSVELKMCPCKLVKSIKNSYVVTDLK